MIKKILIIFLLAIILPLNVSAYNQEEFLNEQYRLSGADKLDESLPDEVKEYIEQYNIEIFNLSQPNELKPENVFSHILNFVKSKASSPLKSAGCVLAIILIRGILGSVEFTEKSGLAVEYAVVLSSVAVICTPILSVISASINAMKGCAVFMTAFIPVFGVISASSGAVATSTAASGILLTASQAVSWIAGFVVAPLLGGYLSLSIASIVSPSVQNSGIAEGIKKTSFWIMSLVTTIFVGILSLQTAITSSSDNLASKTAKFILGTAVPVAGTALSEALNTVTASMGILKASVGIYGVIAVSFIFLPIMLELLLWRICLIVNAAIGDLISVKSVPSLLRSVETVISVLTGIVLLTAAMFIISLSIVISAGGKV